MNTTAHNGSTGAPEPARQRHYGPRTCRICLETVQPTFPTRTSSMASLGFKSDERPVYRSEDVELGRLLSPCMCKGSQRYVHEGCLESWRKMSPNQSSYWQCSICKFSYKISRLSWASYLRSTIVKLALTLTAFLTLIFVLGFVADPILSMWVDPVGTVAETVTGIMSDIEALKRPSHYEPDTWMEHWLKGFFSFGILGFVKFLVGLSPLHWWNVRSSVNGGFVRRPVQDGRGRIENISIYFVVVGAFTFLVAIWKAIGMTSSLLMDKLADSVMDVGTDDGDEEEDETPQTGTAFHAKAE